MKYFSYITGILEMITMKTILLLLKLKYITYRRYFLLQQILRFTFQKYEVTRRSIERKFITHLSSEYSCNTFCTTTVQIQKIISNIIASHFYDSANLYLLKSYYEIMKHFNKRRNLRSSLNQTGLKYLLTNLVCLKGINGMIKKLFYKRKIMLKVILQSTVAIHYVQQQYKYRKL